MNTCHSLYIPYISDEYTLGDLRHLFDQKYRIGKVRQIDFVYSKKKNAHSTGKTPTRSAFVHFEYWYKTDFATFVEHQLTVYGKYNLADFFAHRSQFESEHSLLDFFVDSRTRPVYSPDRLLLCLYRPKTTGAIGAIGEHDSVSELLRSHTSTPYRPLSIQTESAGFREWSEHILHTLQKHEKRIELLEDEIRLLGNSSRPL
jgi:hypothetical protein